ncbi:hypothetical protein ACFLRI_03275 [Bacteroidota bacterium]
MKKFIRKIPWYGIPKIKMYNAAILFFLCVVENLRPARSFD